MLEDILIWRGKGPWEDTDMIISEPLCSKLGSMLRVIILLEDHLPRVAILILKRANK
jgi:hypothetical protein